MEHKVYTANNLRGNMAFPFGKCRCGAYLESRTAIEEHKLLEQEKTSERGDANA
jgi:hypothetical protein